MKITSYIVPEQNTADLIRGIIEFTEDNKLYHKCYVDMYGTVRGFGAIDDVDSKYIEKEVLPNLYEYDNKLLEQGRTPSLADNKQYKPFKEYELKDGNDKWNLSAILKAIIDVRWRVVLDNRDKISERCDEKIREVQKELKALEEEKDKKLAMFSDLKQFSKPHRYAYTKQFSKLKIEDYAKKLGLEPFESVKDRLDPYKYYLFLAKLPDGSVKLYHDFVLPNRFVPNADGTGTYIKVDSGISYEDRLNKESVIEAYDKLIKDYPELNLK